ncbi:MAG: hypothetical protein HKN08_01110 [Gammaproteobacteria bacterium]|nr:hypothetical protein [Gammaproteobacteria bacterium]
MVSPVADVIEDATPEPDEIQLASAQPTADEIFEESTNAQVSEVTMDEPESDSTVAVNTVEPETTVPDLEPDIIESETEIAVITPIDEPTAAQESTSPIDVPAATNLPSSLSANVVMSAGDENIYKLDSVPEQIRGLKGENWYREQPRSTYVLQLISASSLDNVLSLLEGLEDFHEDMSGYVKYTPSGRPRYLLFFGDYSDRAAASNSSSTVPEKLRSIAPYPRSVGSIIDEIEELGYWPR